MALLLPSQIERLFKGALDSTSVYDDEVSRLAYLSSPVCYEGQLITQKNTGEAFVVVKNASGTLEYKSIASATSKFDISTNYDTMVATPPAVDTIYYVKEDTVDVDGITITHEQGFYLYSKDDDQFIELSFNSDTKFTEIGGTSIAVGGLAEGSIITNLTDHAVLKKILFPDAPPVITAFTPTSATYETGTTVGELTLEVSVTKKTYPITSIAFYANDVEIPAVLGDVSNGGTFNVTYSELNGTNKDTDVTFKVVVKDGTMPDVIKTSKISFVRNGFYGSDTTGNTTPTTSAQIRALAGKKVGIKKGDKLTIDVPVGTQMVVLSYPATLGDVSSILFRESLNMEIKTSFVSSSIDVEGADGYTATAHNTLVYIPAISISQASHFDVTI